MQPIEINGVFDQAAAQAAACRVSVSHIDPDQTRPKPQKSSVFPEGGCKGSLSHVKIKTANGERIVPVHPELTRIGFLQHVAEWQASRHPKLFPDIPAAKTGYYSDTFSKFFANFLDKAGAKAPRTSFHSFRHNFRDALREARIDREIALALGGWAGDSGDDGAETADNYGRGFKASTLFEAISLVRHEVDLCHLQVALDS